MEDEDSAAFRKSVSQLAAELVKRATAVTAIKDLPDEIIPPPADQDGGTVQRDAQRSARPQSSADSATLDGDDLGLIDKLAAAEEGIPAITAIMAKIGTRIDEIGSVVAETSDEIEVASARTQSVKATLVLTQRLAKQLDEPASEIEKLGHSYAAELAKLDPGVHALLDLAAQEETNSDDPAEFLAEVQSLAMTADESLTSLQELVDAINQAATLSRSLKEPLRRMRTGVRGVLDGRGIIEEWGRRAKSIEDSR